MQLRPPSIPLVTVDPYFSVWSPTDVLTDSVTVHWTGHPNTLVGIASVDGTDYRFLGKWHPDDTSPVLRQVHRDCDALSTYYTLEGAGISLRLHFLSTLLLDDPARLTRPVSYLHTSVRSTDGQAHHVTLTLAASEEFCLNSRGEHPVDASLLRQDTYTAVRLGNAEQQVLHASGDDVRIDWGYFYLGIGDGQVSTQVRDCPRPRRRGEPAPEQPETMLFAEASASLDTAGTSSALFTLAYDDIRSIDYFGQQLPCCWNRDGKSIETAIAEAYADFPAVSEQCRAFADRLFLEATRAGGEKYAEICEISYRQSVAAHKMAVDENGDLLWISKECFSNGCAATVDVSYPSIPLYLLYNPELVRGMMRPIFRYARSDAWKFAFAPHDAGQFPLVRGQVYGGNAEQYQMPVEECGNMLVMAAAVTLADGKTSFIEENLDLLETWVTYLERHGRDPEHQLCTDDFAGHLAHNCNLSLKAIMGIAGLGILYHLLGREEDSRCKMQEARELADSWAERAANGDGSYRLAFDRAGTWSMKYNLVWDKLFGTNLMNPAVTASEFASYRHHINAYGMPLDCRETYTKSDWLVWTGTLAEKRADFEAFVRPLWEGYNASLSRVPATDWYNTVTGQQRGFQHRSVVGGHFIKLLEASGKMQSWKD